MRTRTKAALIGAATLALVGTGLGIRSHILRQRDHFQQSIAQVEEALKKTTRYAGRTSVALERTAWFQEYIRTHSARTGVPESLLGAVIAHESRGSITAESPTGPRGLGQFTKGTGRAYGLDVERGSVVDRVKKGKATVRQTRQVVVEDERLDPEEAVGAQADHLKDLLDAYAEHGVYAKFFALAAYNQGRGTVDEAIDRAKKEGGPISWPTVSKHLPEEARQYVPSVLAKKIVLENQEHFAEHGLQIPQEAVGAYTRLIAMAREATVERMSMEAFAQKNGFNLEHLRLLNPSISHRVWLGQRTILVPKAEQQDQFNGEARAFEQLHWRDFAFGHERQSEPCNHFSRTEMARFLQRRRMIIPRPTIRRRR